MWEHQGKFSNRKVEYPASSGVWYDRQVEGNCARYLDTELKAGRIKAWERQVRETLKVNGKTITVYVVDFLITHRDKHQEWVEMKEAFSPAALPKIRLFRALYPNRKYTLIRRRGGRDRLAGREDQLGRRLLLVCWF